eukprot:Em0010g798a
MDKALVKEKFLFPWMKTAWFLIDAFRLGKESKVAKPRLIKVRVANSSQRTDDSTKGKDSERLCEILFVRPSHTAVEHSVTSCGKIEIKLEWITTLIGVALFGLHLFSRNCIWSNYC